MNFDELLKKYLLLEKENQMLRKTVERLKSLHDSDLQESNIDFLHIEQQAIANTNKSEIPKNEAKKIVNKHSSSIEKIELFMSLFKGREDVYAKRWENKIQQTSGYSPTCANEWAPGICLKPKIKCSACNHKNYTKLDKQIIENHLRGNVVAGVYPLLTDETCWFLAIDLMMKVGKKISLHSEKFVNNLIFQLPLNAPDQEMAFTPGIFSINRFRPRWPANLVAQCLLTQ
jgi:hypothetical protein